MAVNKVVFGAVSIMDISDSTVTADKLAKGVTAYDKTGEKITGTMEAASTPTLQEKTITPSTASQSITADSGYDGLSKVTVNAMPTATQATPSITVSSAGVITASATQSAGYVAAGTKSATKQLTTQAAKTVTPSTANQTAVAIGRYTTGAVTVKGDANLVAGNIKSGTTIFGVTGTYEGSGGGGSSGGTCNVYFKPEYMINIIGVLNSESVWWNDNSDTLLVQQNSIISVISVAEIYDVDSISAEIIFSVYNETEGVYFSSIYIGNVDEVVLGM